MDAHRRKQWNLQFKSWYWCMLLSDAMYYNLLLKQNNHTSTILRRTYILTRPSFFHSRRNCSAFQYIILESTFVLSTFQMYYIWKPLCSLPTWKYTTNSNLISSLLLIILWWSNMMITHSYITPLFLKPTQY